MRIVANINENTEIIEEAKKAVGCDIYKNGKVVARWTPVAKDRLGKFKIDESLPKRINKKGETEILVLFSVKDVTENNIITIGNIMDENEHVDLILVLNNAGASSFFEQTKNNNGRYMSTIIDDYIYNIQKIISAIGSPSITIDGDFSLVWLKELCNRTPNIYMPGKEGDFTRNWLLPALFTITPIACIIIIYILLFKLIKKGKVSIVTIGLCTLGSLVGAFQFGYSKYYIDNNEYNYFSILWFIVGAILGGFLMFIIYRLFLLLNKRLKFKDGL